MPALLSISLWEERCGEFSNAEKIILDRHVLETRIISPLGMVVRVTPQTRPLLMKLGLTLETRRTMLSVVFLDFDGCLIRFKGIGKKRRPAIPDMLCVVALNSVTDRTNAKIVITSSWRVKTPLEKLVECLRKWGVTGGVIGKTPSIIENCKDRRGKEILHWLTYDESLDDMQVWSFVIVDDEASMGALLARLVQPDPMIGLTMADADQAVKILEVPVC